jgi:uncharacterized protein
MAKLLMRDRDLAVLRGTFSRFRCVHEVRVFGSRATGHARRASDIDLAIAAPDATAAQWRALTEALEEVPIIYEFDIVRTDVTDNSKLLAKIASEGIPIFP